MTLSRERLEKLVRLAIDNPNANESSVAAHQACRLMYDYFEHRRVNKVHQTHQTQAPSAPSIREQMIAKLVEVMADFPLRERDEVDYGVVFGVAERLPLPELAALLSATTRYIKHHAEHPEKAEYRCRSDNWFLQDKWERWRRNKNAPNEG